jgi:hypothetical protein
LTYKGNNNESTENQRRSTSEHMRGLEVRQADLLPVDYYHEVFTLPAPISDIAYQNKAAS